MRRRDFLTGLPGLATMPLMLPQAALAAQSARLKITDVHQALIRMHFRYCEIANLNV